MKKLIPHIFVLLVLFVTSFFINKIPEGFIISGGDFYQLINIEQNLDRSLYTWFNNAGQGQYNPLVSTYPFYFIQKILHNFGFSYSQIGNFIIFQFLILSFYSFYFAQKVLLGNLKYKFIGPFSYTFNLFTFALLFYPWGVTHHILFYIFIPILLSTYTLYLNGAHVFNKYLLYFLIIFIFSIVSYNNVAYLFALLLIEGIIGLLLLCKVNKKVLLIKKSILIVFFQIILSFIVLLPFILSQFGYKDYAIKSQALGGDAITGIMQQTSSSPINSFRMIVGNWNFMENTISQIPKLYFLLFGLLSFIYVVVILYFLINKKEGRKYDNVFYVFLICYVILLFLSFRLTEPFDSLNIIFYKDLTLGLFRSPDKIFMFIPFFTIILFIYSINNISIQKKKGYYSLFGIIILSVSFVLTGGISKQYSYITNGYSHGFVKIPNDYYEIQDIINKDTYQNSILSIPHSIINSINWSNYPKWNFIGHDILHLLYNKNYISANSYDHIVIENNFSLKSFSDSSIELDQLIRTIQKFGGRFILDHKDIDSQFLGLTRINIEKLQSENIIKNIYSSEFFELYEVDKKYLLPIIFSKETSFKKINPTQYDISVNSSGGNAIDFKQSHNPQWKLYLEPYSDIDCKNPNTYSGSLNEKTENYTIQAGDDYQKIVRNNTGVTLESLRELNPDIDERDLKIGQTITLKKSAGDSYNVTECESENRFYVGGELSKLWEKPIFNDTHKMVYDYANQWTLDPAYIKANYDKEYYRENPDGSIDVRMTLYFKPQSYFYLGLMISGSTLILLLSYLGYDVVRNRRRKDSEKEKIIKLNKI